MTITVLFQTNGSPSELKSKVFISIKEAENFIKTTNSLISAKILVEYATMEFYKEQFELYQGIVHNQFINKSPLNMILEEEDVKQDS